MDPTSSANSPTRFCTVGHIAGPYCLNRNATVKKRTLRVRIEHTIKIQIGSALEAEIKRRESGQNKDYSALIQALHSSTVESTTSRYTDRGYAKDHPPGLLALCRT